MTGKIEIADRWEKDVYLVVDQSNKDIPFHIVKLKHCRGRHRLLHRNVLLPFMSLSAYKPNLLDASLPAGSV